jgi:class 3 adenylate cyclase/lipopolysaccharide biosynthesis regulator YciM
MKKIIYKGFFYSLIFLFSQGLRAQSLDSLQRFSISTNINKFVQEEKWQAALQLADNELSNATLRKSNQDQAFCNYLKGTIYKAHEKLDSAILFLTAANQIFDKNLNDNPDYAQKTTASVAALLGACYHEKYSYPEAIDFYQKALKIYEIRQDKSALASLLIDISLFYRDVGKFKNAFDYGFRALNLHQELKQNDMVSYDLLNIAIYYDETGEYDKALEYYFKVLDTKTGDLANTYNNIASTYKNKKQYDEALVFLEKALESALRNSQTEYLSLIEATFCEILFLKNQKEEALKHGLKSLEYGRNDNQLEVIKAVSLILSKIYEEKGEPIKAYSLYKEHIAARDSLNNELKDKDITRKIALYDFEANQQEKVKEQLRKDAIASAEKKALYGGLTLMGLLVALTFRNFRRERKAKAAIAIEQQKSEELLLNILPKHVADELKARGAAEARSYEKVSVLFADFKDFTKVSEQVTPSELVALINVYFTEFDKIITRYRLEKIKTIGDAYVCASGLNDEGVDDTGVRLIYAAIEMQHFIQILKEKALKENRPYFEQRIGISTGSVVAGIVGLKKFTYDIWGDTVNVAARMEQNSEAGKINISEATYELVKEHFDCTYRGKVVAKNKGEINMYFVNS